MKRKVQLVVVGLLVVGAGLVGDYALKKADQLTTVLQETSRRLDEAEKRIEVAEYRAKLAKNDRQRTKTRVKMLRLAAVVRRDLDDMGASSDDPFQLATALRNHLYQKVPLKRSPDGFDFLDLDRSYLDSVCDDSVGHICGGLAHLYATALESQGIPARYVGIFSKNRLHADNHATVEFWHDGRWCASDPTFNVMFKRRGRHLSYTELYDLVKRGKSYEIVTNGYPLLPNRKIEEYPVQLDELMNYMVVHPSKVRADGGETNYPMQLIPADWRGTVKADDGEEIDVRGYGPLAQFLVRGPLR